MDKELDYMHSLQLEWGCITNLMCKISDIEDKIEGGWEELADMLTLATDEEERGNQDPVDVFFHLYMFLFRLYYRLKANPTVRKFNIVTEVDLYDKKYFRVTNYDYAMFRWAKRNKYDERMTNDYFDVEIEKLPKKVVLNFRKRIS